MGEWQTQYDENGVEYSVYYDYVWIGSQGPFLVERGAVYGAESDPPDLTVLKGIRSEVPLNFVAPQEPTDGIRLEDLSTVIGGINPGEEWENNSGGALAAGVLYGLDGAGVIVPADATTGIALFVLSYAVADGALFRPVSQGRFVKLATDDVGFTPRHPVYLTADGSGKVTKTMPASPAYGQMVGVALEADPVEGKILCVLNISLSVSA